MKKIACLATALAVCLAGVAYAAVEADQGLEAKVTGKKGTKKKPHSVKLAVTTKTEGKGTTPSGTFGTKSAVIFFDKNLTFNPEDFPACAFLTVLNEPTKCPAGSKVGKGQSKAQGGPDPGGIHVTPSVTAYNGKSVPKGQLAPGQSSKGPFFLLKVDTPPGQAPETHEVLVGTLQKATGKYGKKLVVNVPAKLQNQFGIFITIQEFSTSVSGNRKGIGYVESVGCKGGKYVFKGDFVYTDDSKHSATATAKC